MTPSDFDQATKNHRATITDQGNTSSRPNCQEAHPTDRQAALAGDLINTDAHHVSLRRRLLRHHFDVYRLHRRGRALRRPEHPFDEVRR